MFPKVVLYHLFQFTDHHILFVCKRWYEIGKLYINHYRWLYYIKIYDGGCVQPDIPLWVAKAIDVDPNMLLRSDSLEVIKYAASKGASNWNICLNSSNLDVVHYAISKGATYWDWCLRSPNLDVVLLGESYGASCWCLENESLEVVKYIASKNCSDWDCCLESSNLDVVLYAVQHGADAWEKCLGSDNLFVRQFGRKKLK